ncbi:MAG: hypothetical protein A4E53_03398 [Pelotomaculum sp. PtaB.Bin104]|nr:MAG: hypothetical protein A4E53_03398 [Pelotomaculum sp. PtaB.Bin104]
MRFRLLGIRTLIIGIALVTGIIAGAFGSGYAIAKSVSAPVHVFPKNESGMTYGSDLDVTSIDEEPDLILAYGVDGTLGYVLFKDLEGEKPKTPQEALAQQSKNGDKVRQIPLYAVDGKTVIGVFNIDPGRDIEKPAVINPSIE